MNLRIICAPLHSPYRRSIFCITIFSIAALLMLLGLACGVGAQTSIGSTVPGSNATLHEPYPRYTIKRQDTLQVRFPIAPEFDQTVSVQPDGFINLQGVPSLHVQGLTLDEIRPLLVARYSQILHDPMITIDVKDFQKPFFTVNGQVGKPGQYELRDDLTVNEGIAIAGGLSPTAKEHVFLFRRTSADQFSVKQIDLKDLFKGKRPRESDLIHPGDMILVPESAITKFRKYVPYAVGASYFPTT